MLEKINLLPGIKEVWEKTARMQRLIQVASVLTLILYFVLLSLLLSYFLVLTKEEESLKKKIGINEAKIKRLEPIESKHVFLKAKLKELSKVLKIEEKPEEVLEDLEALTIPGISLSEIDYTDKILKISVKAGDVLILDEFMKNLEGEGRSHFSRAELGSASRTPEGDYSVDLVLFKEAKLVSR